MGNAPKAPSGSILGLAFNAVLVGPCVGLIAMGLTGFLDGSSRSLPLRLTGVLVFVAWAYVIYRVALAANRSHGGAAAVAVAAVLWSVAGGILLLALALAST
ncbi:MAG TPA: hypothetical protein PKB03_08160 [Baekduia sp.]|nr:hypothetical protein [Baekduia sp.]